MVINRIDGKAYASAADFPNYGNWMLVSVDGNIRTLGGDSDTTLLPTNLPPTSKALATTGTLYNWDGSQWRAVK